MFCVKCGVKLAETEKVCPLCNTTVYHPDIQQADVPSLYPKQKMPKVSSVNKALGGVVVILFLIPLLLSFFSDIQSDGVLDWFGYVGGALVVSYVIIALPWWFKKPNPIIFVPCGFAATILYLLYIDLATDGRWFLSFAFPVAGALALIVCAVVTLTTVLSKGKLYIFGGMFAALGAWLLLTEYLVNITFGVPFIGWSVYPLVVLVVLGGLLIYLAINRAAREVVARKLFF